MTASLIKLSYGFDFHELLDFVFLKLLKFRIYLQSVMGFSVKSNKTNCFGMFQKLFMLLPLILRKVNQELCSSSTFSILLFSIFKYVSQTIFPIPDRNFPSKLDTVSQVTFVGMLMKLILGQHFIVRFLTSLKVLMNPKEVSYTKLLLISSLSPSIQFLYFKIISWSYSSELFNCTFYNSIQLILQ
ncbi:Hypothetical_protein [Hexamita inflata]|uniref:Hypothetical_protein n=1 Tax=Hexamita inflata TaxID=28002 RepID=A0ABP1GL60_9EUKA